MGVITQKVGDGSYLNTDTSAVLSVPMEFLFLLDDTGLFNGIDEAPAAAIATRDLADLSAGDLDDGIADAHAGQCSQAMFDRFDEESAVT